MNSTSRISHSILWASAIVAAAIAGAPRPFALIVLPALAAVALILPEMKPAVACAVRRQERRD